LHKRNLAGETYVRCSQHQAKVITVERQKLGRTPYSASATRICINVHRESVRSVCMDWHVLIGAAWVPKQNLAQPFLFK
jgi:hypothetical protein